LVELLRRDPGQVDIQLRVPLADDGSAQRLPRDELGEPGLGLGVEVDDDEIHHLHGGVLEGRLLQRLELSRVLLGDTEIDIQRVRRTASPGELLQNADHGHHHGLAVPGRQRIAHLQVGLEAADRKAEAIELGHPTDPLMLVRVHREAGAHAAFEINRHGRHRCPPHRYKRRPCTGRPSGECERAGC
jgi:hypothetical protein